jgi:hypothetical protein
MRLTKTVLDLINEAEMLGCIGCTHKNLCQKMRGLRDIILMGAVRPQLREPIKNTGRYAVKFRPVLDQTLREFIEGLDAKFPEPEGVKPFMDVYDDYLWDLDEAEILDSYSAWTIFSKNNRNSNRSRVEKI